MSNAAAAISETKEEMKARLKKAAKKKMRSLPIMVMESDLYDHQPGTQMTLMVIALGTRTNADAWIAPDCPLSAEEAIGWCDMAQWRIALRAKKSESQVNKDILRFEKDGVLQIDRWTDDNGIHHDMYKINVDVVKERQRPEQSATVKRPSRYKTKNPNRGHFSAKNQPRKVNPAVAEMDEE